jgi:hypothetical protein
MAKDDPGKTPKSVVSAPSTKVTIAFPFSNIKSAEPSEELRELASIVAELTDHVAKLRPSAETDALVQRAQAIITKL